MHNKALMLTIRTADHLVACAEADAAADILERYLAAHPRHGHVLARLGRVRLMQGRAAEAATLLKQALECSNDASPGDGQSRPVGVAEPPSAAAR